MLLGIMKVSKVKSTPSYRVISVRCSDFALGGPIRFLIE